MNCVVALETELPAHDVLRFCQAIEQKQGRIRAGERWGPRCIDVDVVLYGAERIKTDDLEVPHYDLMNREFVLLPLFDVAPELVLPSGERLADLAEHCPKRGIQLVSETLYSEGLLCHE